MLIEPLDIAQRDVAEAVHAVWLLANAQERALLGSSDPGPPLRTVADLQASRAFHLCALIGADLVGALALEPDDEPGQLHITMLVVHPAHQRQGIARALILGVSQRAGGAVLSVTTTAGNSPALALYESLGFAIYRRGSMGTQEQAVVKLRTGPMTPDR